jgi:hypothetical protein
MPAYFETESVAKMPIKQNCLVLSNPFHPGLINKGKNTSQPRREGSKSLEEPEKPSRDKYTRQGEVSLYH